jgi:hypothetical protein
VGINLHRHMNRPTDTVNRLGAIWEFTGTKQTELILFGRYVPMAGTKSTCVGALTSVGTVSNTFIELIEKRKRKLCQVSGGYVSCGLCSCNP